MDDEVFDTTDQAGHDFTTNDDDYAETSFGGDQNNDTITVPPTETPGCFRSIEERPNPEDLEYSEVAEKKWFDDFAKHPMQERLMFVRNKAGQIGVDWDGDVKILTNERTGELLSATTI